MAGKLIAFHKFLNENYKVASVHESLYMNQTNIYKTYQYL